MFLSYFTTITILNDNKQEMIYRPVLSKSDNYDIYQWKQLHICTGEKKIIEAISAAIYSAFSQIWSVTFITWLDINTSKKTFMTSFKY